MDRYPSQRYVDIFYCRRVSIVYPIPFDRTGIDLVALTDENSVIYFYFELFLYHLSRFIQPGNLPDQNY